MNNIYIISDLSLAAFLSMKGLEIRKAIKHNDGKFKLDNHNQMAARLSLEYINSDFSKFDNQIRLIKKLLYSKQGVYNG